MARSVAAPVAGSVDPPPTGPPSEYARRSGERLIRNAHLMIVVICGSAVWVSSARIWRVAGATQWTTSILHRPHRVSRFCVRAAWIALGRPWFLQATTGSLLLHVVTRRSIGGTWTVRFHCTPLLRCPIHWRSLGLRLRCGQCDGPGASQENASH